MREVVIASSVRTPVGKAFKGTLRATRPDDLGAVAIRGALARIPQLDVKEIEDVILGCAMPEAESGNNMARVVALRAGLPDSVPGFTINRFCMIVLTVMSALAPPRTPICTSRPSTARTSRFFWTYSPPTMSRTTLTPAPPVRSRMAATNSVSRFCSAPTRSTRYWARSIACCISAMARPRSVQSMR